MQEVVTITEMFDEAMTKVGRQLPIIVVEHVSLDGDILTYKGRLTFSNKSTTKKLSVAATKSIAKRNPMHTMNGTFNMELVSGEIKTVHTNLVRSYNDKKVVLYVNG